MSSSILPDESSSNNGKPFDPLAPENLRLTQDFGAGLGVKKLPRPKARKPNKHEFIRVKPGAENRIEVALFELKPTRDLYVVPAFMQSEMKAEFPNDVSPAALFLTINRQGDVFLWPIKLPGADGRSNDWNQSAIDAANVAEKQWVRVAANMSAGHYDCLVAGSVMAEPEWPDMTFHEALKIAFKNCWIDGPDHPVLKSLRGEV